MSRSQIAAIGVAVAAVVFWLSTRGSEPPRSPAPVARATQVAAPTATTAIRAPAATATAASRATATARASETPRGTLTPTVRATPTPQSYSMAIADAIDPIEQQRAVEVGESRGRGSRHLRLVTFPSASSYEAPNAVLLYAYLAEVDAEDEQGERGSVEDAPRVPAREITAVLRNRNGDALAALTFHDDGQSGDARAGDDVFTVQYLPSPEQDVDLGKLTLVVQATSQKGEQRTATTSFLYSIVAARLTGGYRDELVNGDLRLSIEVEVDDAGTFDVQATIADEQGKLVAWGDAIVQLQPGTHWIPLTYDGSILRSHGVDGPYLVSSVALDGVSTDPPLRNDVVASPYLTHAYHASEFGGRR